MDSYNRNYDSTEANQRQQNGASTYNSTPQQSGRYQEPPKQQEPITLDLPEIPSADLTFDFSSFMDSSQPEQEKVTKRASNVQKLAKENEKLQAELKAMAERLEAVERKRAELAEKAQKEGQQPSF